MRLKKILISYFLVYLHIFLCAQSALGIVNDSNKNPISDANVLVYKSVNGDFLGFGVTDKFGKFSVNIKNGIDSVFIQIEHLSFESYSKMIKVNLEHEIILEERTTQLPEVKITNNRVQRIGDTLIYDVAQYKKANDTNIEDILRKLPGVEISDNGTILYNNEPISQFYIEGLDMLEGRYKIATRGLNIEAVSEIQVLENHQHIKALKNIVVPSKAAINIKLKSGIRHTGKYEGGLGFSPFLFNIKGNLFGFSKNYQYNVIGAGNNIGQNNADIFQRMTTIVMEGQSSTVNSELLSVTDPITPRLRNELHRLNNEQVVGINFLKKLSNDVQIKYNASAQRDKLIREGENNFSLFDQSNTFSLSESISTTSRNRGMDHALKIETNKSKIFFNADILGETLPSNHVGDQLLNSNVVSENLKKALVKGKADMKLILRKGSKAYQISSYIDYQNENDSLTIMPTTFTLPNEGTLSLDDVTQIARQQLIKSHTYTSFLVRKNQYKYEVSTGIRTRHSWLKSNLEGLQGQISEQFRNDIFNGGTSFYINQELKKDGRILSYGFRLPLSLQTFALQSSDNLAKPIQQEYLLYQPSASLSYKYNYKYVTSLSTTYNSNADFQQLYYDRYILKSNRNLSRRLPEVFTSQGLNLSSSHMIQSLLGGDERLFISFNWNRGAQNQLMNNNFNSTSVVADVSNQKNMVTGYGTNGMFKSELFTRNLVLDVNYFLVINFSDQRLNDVLTRIQTNMFNLNTSIDYTPFDRLGIKAFIIFNRFATNISPKTNNISYVGQIYISPYKNVDWKINFDLIHNNTINQKNLNSVFSSELAYKLPSQKLSFSLQLFNITNTNTYQSINQTVFQLQESTFRLRPRQVFLGVRKLI
jgi:hypothetical protein